MARSGINKFLVKQARDALLAKGQYPSIDVVRVQLGNTGSKSTISRYLKELEEEEATQLGNEAFLSSALKNMIGELASRLQEEAQEVVKEANEKLKNEQAAWQTRHHNQQQALSAAEKHIASLEGQLVTAQTQGQAATKAQQAMTIKTIALEQEVSSLKALTTEKDNHIQSLEEKHQHSRDALEHYRQSVKEQREKEQYRHEQQIQQLQSEIRQLNQMLSVKQADITQLNRDNARLVTELSEIRKQLSIVETALKKYKDTQKNADEKIILLTTEINNQQKIIDDKTKLLSHLNDQLEASDKAKHKLEIDIVALQTELALKTQFIEK
ncbi:DNA-binding protein [Zooshikella ganghwensis]|uniref:Integrase n=1 Tax=Zooshikella ganghwensis TaxID=202772 RepID=A0A4V1IMY7_9GAMM|nr:DNA-binding protein [Zooshikella ganghwensis]RDH41871.1 integrase [Zooshikella ganghwensis]